MEVLKQTTWLDGDNIMINVEIMGKSLSLGLHGTLKSYFSPILAIEVGNGMSTSISMISTKLVQKLQHHPMTPT